MVQQVDRINGLVGDLGMKAPVRVATTANITLSGLQTVDGVVLVAGDRVLVKDQTAGAENGIYAASATTWLREPDWDGSRDVVTGTAFKVNEGTQAAIWAVVTSGTITVGTTAVTFARFFGAADITNTPAGGIVAVTVQAAINELDTDKVPRTSLTGSAKLPSGTTAQRDGTPAVGYTRFNSDYDKPEVYDGTSWTGLGGASGAGGDAVFYENDIVVNTPYVIGNCTFKTVASGLVTNNQVTDATNSLANGAYVSLDSFSGTLPAGLTIGKQYFVVGSVANTSFQLSLTSGGAAITFTGAAGSLVLTNGKLKHAMFSGNVEFNAAVTVPSGSRLTAV